LQPQLFWSTLVQRRMTEQAYVNVNCGILGHVDSGKTSLVKALSTWLSTCALDKHPQSQQRGITLDLGFSAFTLPMPEHLLSADPTLENTLLQVTLVDCPGHASLIRTIIGGAQIIDMMLLVVDANKGIQTQTAECIVIGEITTDNLIIVLNKIDALPVEDREARLEKMAARIRKTFSTTKFKDAPIVYTAASVGGEKVAAIVDGGGQQGASVAESNQTMGVDTLVDLIRSTVQLPRRNADLPFYFAIDHCFSIKGHGTVLTGTVLSGSVGINSTIELPELQQSRKVRSMQMFRRPVKGARQGDRVGICVTNLNSALVERGIATAPGSVPLISSALCLVKKVRFFRSTCRSGAKYHVSIGHTTVVADAMFFGAAELAAKLGSESEGGKGGGEGAGEGASLSATYRRLFPQLTLDFERDDFELQPELSGLPPDGPSAVYGAEPVQWALLSFQQPVYCPLDSLVIGSRLDALSKDGSNAAAQCRLAFFGPVVESLDDDAAERIKIFSWKSKGCEVFKETDCKDGQCFELVAWRLFGEGGSVRPFVNLVLETPDGHSGVISGAYGAGGKFKVKFASGVPLESVAPGTPLVLRYKRYVNDKLKLMCQDQLPGSVAEADESEAGAEERGADSAEASAEESTALFGGSGGVVEKKKGASISLAPLMFKPPPEPEPEGRLGSIESLKDDLPGGRFATAIVTGAFRIEENIKLHAGAKVRGPGGEIGELKGPFAKLGKCKVSFPEGLGPDACGLKLKIFVD